MLDLGGSSKDSIVFSFLGGLGYSFSDLRGMTDTESPEYVRVNEREYSSVENILNTTVLFPRAYIEGPETIRTNSSVELTLSMRQREYDEETGEYDPTGDVISDADIRISLETTAGYLPVNKFYTKGGQYRFKFYADRVDPGTVISIKANTDNYTKIGDIKLTVTE